MQGYQNGTGAEALAAAAAAAREQEEEDDDDEDGEEDDDDDEGDDGEGVFVAFLQYLSRELGTLTGIDGTESRPVFISHGNVPCSPLP